MHISLPALITTVLAFASVARAAAVPRPELEAPDDCKCSLLKFGDWCFKNAECCSNNCDYYHCAEKLPKTVSRPNSACGIG